MLDEEAIQGIKPDLNSSSGYYKCVIDMGFIQTNRKGFRPSIRRKRYTFQPGDMVLHDHERFSVVGVHNYGKSIVLSGSGSTGRPFVLSASMKLPD